MKKCKVCDKNLEGRQTKFCSVSCKNKLTNKTLQSTEAQQKRGISRKIKLIDMLGGECSSCRYKKNLSALCFHHKDPSKKKMQLDMRRCSNNRWEVLVEEAKKCTLLCSNCHMEEHKPHLVLKTLRKTLNL